MTWVTEQTAALEAVRDRFGVAAILGDRSSGVYDPATGTYGTAAVAEDAVTVWDEPEDQLADPVGSGRPPVDRAVYRVMAADCASTPTASGSTLTIGSETWSITRVGRECRGLVYVLHCEKLA